MSGPFRGETPAQAAGLIAGGSTDDDRALWADFKASPEAQRIRQQRADERLARRRELIAARDAELERLAKQEREINEQKRRAEARLEEAEQAWRAAIVAARELPMWAPTSSPELLRIDRELAATEPAEIDELLEYLQHEHDVTRSHGAPLEMAPSMGMGKPSVGLDQRVHRALEERMRLIHDAIGSARDLKGHAMTHAELTAAIEQILARVPELPKGASRQVALHTPFTFSLGSDGAARRAPVPEVAQRERRIAAIGEQHQRIVAETKRRSRK